MEKYLLITGIIARGALAKVAGKITEKDLTIKSLPCTVAALMSTDFIARELGKEGMCTGEETVVIPGLCTGPLEPIAAATGCKAVKGPKDLTDLPAFFQAGPKSSPESFCQTPSPIQILAEIVDAPRMSLEQILNKAFYYRESGADIIDLGGDIRQPFPDLGQIIKALKREGFKVSIDSHQEEDILAAGQAGADLVLSLTSRNIHLAPALSCPAVVIPDDGTDLDSLYRNMEKLEQWKIPYLADPILPPPTLGLAEGIGRFIKVRQDYPDCQMLMGLGNVTELMDADSVGVNALLVGMAGELGINYLLTTEVAWRARGSVKEISLARSLIHRAILEERVPKHMDDSLLTIKDDKGNSFAPSDLWEMHRVIKDKNYRIFVADQIYIFNAHCFLEGASAEELYARLDVRDPKHAFYLGRELGKAELALRLGKKYVQDDDLNWGYFTRTRDKTQDKTKERGSLDDSGNNSFFPG